MSTPEAHFVAARTTSRSDVDRAEVDAVLRRVRQIGWALLVAAMIIDAGEARFNRIRRQLHTLPQLAADKIERRGAGIAEIGLSLLDTSTQSHSSR